MQEDLIILVAGAIFGFLSALLVELIKSRLEKNRLRQKRAMESMEEREKNLREFLSSTQDKKIAPAWLTLIKTNHPLPFFQKSQTGNSMSLNPTEKQKPDNAETSVKPTLEKFLFSQTQIIGRQEDCEIRLSDSTVSRLHAMVRYEEGDFVIYDLASKSGSFVNGTRVNKDGVILQFGDKLKIGDSVFRFDGYSKANKALNEDKKNEAVITKPPLKSISQNKQKNGLDKNSQD